MAGSEDVYLQIKPIGIETLSATKETHTEKFCFFFLAREKVSYTVNLLVHVEMTVVSMDKLTFVDVQKETVNGYEMRRLFNRFYLFKEERHWRF